MEKIKYNGVNGVFIPCDEFKTLKALIKHNGELLQKLSNERKTYEQFYINRY